MMGEREREENLIIININDKSVIDLYSSVYR